MRDLARCNRFIKFALIVSLIALSAVTLYVELAFDKLEKREETREEPIVIFLTEPERVSEKKEEPKVNRESALVAEEKPIAAPANICPAPKKPVVPRTVCPPKKTAPSVANVCPAPRKPPFKRAEICRPVKRPALPPRKEAARGPERYPKKTRSGNFAKTPASPADPRDAIIKRTARRTGVSPRLIEAILTVESQKGVVMGETNMFYRIPQDQRRSLLRICRELRRNPNSVPLAPMGEMGPAQFRPETWLWLKDEISLATGKRHPDPWNFEDAATATALYLGILGVDDNEYLAIRKYNAGNGWNAKGWQYLMKVLSVKRRSKL